MAKCFCSCGNKVPFGRRAINTRGRLLLERIDRLDRLIHHHKAEAPTNLSSVEAFRDEGLVYCEVLTNFLHAGKSPSDDLETVTRDWLARERKLYLDIRNPERSTMMRFGAAARAQGLEPNAAAEAFSSGQFNIYAALVPSPDIARACDEIGAMNEAFAKLVADLQD